MLMIFGPEIRTPADLALWSAVYVGGILLALWLFHRLLLWMEDQGWIVLTARREDLFRSASRSVLEVQQLMEPSKRHVLEMKRRDDQKKEQATASGSSCAGSQE